MDIITKFGVGYTVFILQFNKIVECEIEEVHLIAKNKSHKKVTLDTYYTVRSADRVYTEISEDNMYVTRKEAAKALIRQIGYEISEDDLKEIK